MEKRNELFYYLAMLGCGITILSLFLPYISVSSQGLKMSVNFIVGDGKIVIVVAIVSLLLLLAKKVKVAAIVSLIGIGVNVYNMIKVQSLLNDDYCFYDIGAYLLYVGSAMTFLCGLCAKSNSSQAISNYDFNNTMN